MDAELRKQAETLAKIASLDRSGRTAEAARLAASRAFQVVRKQGADIVSSHNVCSTAHGRWYASTRHLPAGGVRLLRVL